MTDTDLTFDVRRAIERLMRFLSVEGVTGQEKAIGREVVTALLEVGVPRKAIRFDAAEERIPLPTETGNLIVTLPGTRRGQRHLFMTHLDTVPLAAGAKPVRQGNRIRPLGGLTALGGDNRTGVACLVTLIATLLEKQLPYPPLTFLFTVREESGLWGARHVDPTDLGRPVMGFNVDGSSAREITIGAVGAERWEAQVFGRASHAGVAPEKGISATVVASLALADVFRQGWFGKICKDGQEGTANVGIFGGASGTSAGDATNVVTAHVTVRGEARSHDSRFVRQITTAYREAFRSAARQVMDDRGRGARLVFQTRRDYYPFRLANSSPVVQQAQAAATRLGWQAILRVTNGGLDANWMVRHRIPTITFGAGQHNAHTTDEYVDLDQFEEGCRYALALATHGLDAADGKG
jgi:tripeptide aminopeptidase